MLHSNKAQEQAINTVNGPVILISVPGSGKTTTMVRRIRHMEESGIPGESILMMTFSRAAARDMKARYQALFKTETEATFCTIHSFCLAVLSKYKGVTSDNVLAATAQYDFFFDYMKGFQGIADKFSFISDLLLDFGNMKNSGIPAHQYKQTCCNDNALFLKLYNAYEDFKYNTHKIDYDDMLVNACDEIHDNPECLEYLQEHYKYIMVDEFQDTNFIQSRIIYKVAEKYRNICVVGDDDQSIYAFRGARPRIMLDFNKVFPEAVVIRNDTNYRSVSSVIGYADSLVSHNNERFKKEFKPDRKEKGIVSFNGLPTREIEISSVVAEIMTLLKEGKKPTDIAVLYRTNKQSAALAEQLLARGIPVFSNEKIESKFESFIWSDILAYYRLSVGKGTNFDVSQTINHPNRYLYGSAYYKMGLNKAYMLDFIESLDKEDWQKKSAKKKVTEYFVLLKDLSGKKPSDFMATLYDNGYRDHIKDYATFRKLPPGELNSIWDSILQEAKKYDDWEKLVRRADSYNSVLRNAVKDPNGVSLSTMHGAKGLEWDTVFIIDAVDGVNPYTKASAPEELEEERRLFYVAVTRAKNNLHVCWYNIDMGTILEPSPYIGEMRKKEMKRIEEEKMEEVRSKKTTLKDRLLDASLHS